MLAKKTFGLWLRSFRNFNNFITHIIKRSKKWSNKKECQKSKTKMAQKGGLTRTTNFFLLIRNFWTSARGGHVPTIGKVGSLKEHRLGYMQNEVELSIQVRLFVSWVIFVTQMAWRSSMSFVTTLWGAHLPVLWILPISWRGQPTVEWSTFNLSANWRVDGRGFSSSRLGDHFSELSRLLVIPQIEDVIAELDGVLLPDLDIQIILLLNGTDPSFRIGSVFSVPEFIYYAVA